MADNAGRKDDSGKGSWNLLPFDAIGEIVKVLDFGAKKYAPHNWAKGMDWNRPFDALMRHLVAWWGGQAKDPETGISHLAHAGCNILFLIAYELRGIGTDNRPSAEPKVRTAPKIPRQDPIGEYVRRMQQAGIEPFTTTDYDRS